MPITIDQQKQLSQLLSAELEDSHLLLNILLEEHQSLGAADPDQITTINAKKISGLKKIEIHAKNREKFLANVKISPDLKSIDSLIQKLSENKSITTKWIELQSLAKQMQRQNEINGGIIALTQRHITLALDILTGKASTSPTYGPQGQANTDSVSQRLAKA